MVINILEHRWPPVLSLDEDKHTPCTTVAGSGSGVSPGDQLAVESTWHISPIGKALLGHITR